MTPDQIELARHALGLTGGRSRSYRNRYLSALGGETEAAWSALVSTGHAERGAGTSTGVWFYLTRAGAEAVLRPGESLDPEDFPAVAA